MVDDDSIVENRDTIPNNWLIVRHAVRDQPAVANN
jgi:hypothetical protein